MMLARLSKFQKLGKSGQHYTFSNTNIHFDTEQQFAGNKIVPIFSDYAHSEMTFVECEFQQVVW